MEHPTEVRLGPELLADKISKLRYDGMVEFFNWLGIKMHNQAVGDECNCKDRLATHVFAIARAIRQAEEAAKDEIEEVLAATKQPKPGAMRLPSKPVKTVTASTYLAKTCLESEADVDDYLGTLRKELVSALQGGYRVRIK